MNTYRLARIPHLDVAHRVPLSKLCYTIVYYAMLYYHILYNNLTSYRCDRVGVCSPELEILGVSSRSQSPKRVPSKAPSKDQKPRGPGRVLRFPKSGFR